MGWRRWAKDDPHPWVAKVEERAGGPFIGIGCHEVRLYSPEGARWPLLSISTRVLAPGSECDGCYAVHAAAIPCVNVSVGLKTGPRDEWDQAPFHAGIPADLVPDAVEMLLAARDEARRLVPAACQECKFAPMRSDARPNDEPLGPCLRCRLMLCEGCADAHSNYDCREGRE